MDSNNPILEYNADMNQDGNINVTDAIQLITQLSQGQWPCDELRIVQIILASAANYQEFN